MKAEPTAWILLRGLARESGHWGPFVDQFKAAFPGDDVIALDLPGVGEFAKERSPRSVQEIFTFVRAEAVKRAKSQSPFKLVAMSLGGMVAMDWMEEKPDDLSAVVLINVSAKGFSPAYKRLRWQVWPGFLKAVSSQSFKEREKLLIDMLINSPEAREKALPVWVKIANEQRISYASFANQLLAAARFQGLKKEAPVPVLLLNGLGDRFVDPSCSTVLHEKWGWPLERHAWGGHDLPWDDPAWVINKIRDWNKSLDASH
jgi:pimeloyl-ACP methyl ester carboxylesterase